MDIQEISVYIDKNGEVRIEVRGAKGLECLELTRELEAALGSQVVEREMTPEALEEGQKIEPGEHLEQKS